MITITDMHGNTISWASSGKAGFKGSKKSTPFAATVAAEACAREALGLGLKRVHVRVQGPGSGRESAIQALGAAGLAGSLDQGCHADSAQRLPSAEASSRVMHESRAQSPGSSQVQVHHLGRDPNSHTGSPAH